MRYSVTWWPEATAHLAELWMQASDRQAIADAADRIDAALRDRPLEVGESRDGKARILIENPLGIDYRVYADDRRVHVLLV